MAQPLMVELAKRGHEVTFISPFALGQSVKNYHDVVIPVGTAARGKNSTLLEKESSYIIFSDLTKRVTSKEQSHNMLTWLPKLITLSLDATNVTLKHPDFRVIMDEKFDLIVFGYFINNFQLGLAEHFKCPSVVLSSGPFFRFLEGLLGHPNNPEATRSVMIGRNDELKGMTFFDRVLNMMAFGLENLMFFYTEYRNQVFFQ